MRKSPPHEPKKTPRQERSRATVDYILQAAAQILSEDGPYSLSTNRIARKAGVAVASLYQYFPNKEAIVNALFERELSEERAELATRTALLTGAPTREAIRVAVRSTIAIHARMPKLVTSILQSIPFLGGAEAHVRARQHVVDLVRDTLRQRQDELRSPENLEVKAFLVVHAVEGVIHDAASERPDYLTTPAFEEELVALVERFLLQA
jgi:AcrR family transcriptional regulator